MAIIKVRGQRECYEGLYATKDGKDYQIEIELEGETDAPKRCTVIVNGEKADVEVGKKADKDEIEKSIKKGIEKLGYKVAESKKSEGYGNPTIADVRRYLERTMDELDSYDDEDRVIMSPNTYGISNYFIALGNYGYMPMERFDVDEGEEEDESCKRHPAKEALQKKVKEAKRKACKGK